MPADGSAPPGSSAAGIPGGEKTGLLKAWSPDGTRVLVRRPRTRTTVYSIDPASGATEALIPWTTELPDWQRIARR